MRALVTGVNGQLGHDVVKLLSEHNVHVVGLDRQEMDLTNASQVNEVLTSHRPTVIVHCAAWTDVEGAEDEDKKELCHRVNVEGTRNIVNYAKEHNIKMVYISTDYVFDGTKEGIYNVGDITNPINEYGLSKRDGEEVVKTLEKHFIIRISWVFGANGKNFIKTMLNLASRFDELKVVDDQIGSPTYTKDLSVLIYDMIQTEKFGTYHATNEGYCSWFEFAKEIFKQANVVVNVLPVPATNFPTKAKRPMNSKLDKSKLDENGFNRLPTWQDALSRYLKEIEVV